MINFPATSFADDVDVVVTRLDVEPEAVRSSEALLSASERGRAVRFAFNRDRRRFIVARARLRQLLGARLNVSPQSVELVYGPHGKPALANHLAKSNLRFNVSHSDDLAVYAFSTEGEIGIDIEAIRPVPDSDRIAARYFSRREYETWSRLVPAERPLGFFNCWTRKEAFIKALGDGLSHPLDAFDVSLAPWEPARILSVENTSGDDCAWRMDSFCPAPGFVAALCRREQPCR